MFALSRPTSRFIRPASLSSPSDRDELLQQLPLASLYHHGSSNRALELVRRRHWGRASGEVAPWANTQGTPLDNLHATSRHVPSRPSRPPLPPP